MGMVQVKSEITGTVWKVVVKQGDRVAEDDVLLILESMKMEIPLTAPQAGTVREILVGENSPLAEGQVAVVLEV